LLDFITTVFITKAYHINHVSARTNYAKLYFLAYLVVGCRDCRDFGELAGHFCIGRAFGRAYFS